MNHWTEEKLNWYIEAGTHSEYPRIFVPLIKERLLPGDTLLDIGSGPGLFALSLTPWVKAVYNIDSQALPLKYLQQKAREKNNASIFCLQGEWPEMELDLQVSASLSAFTSPAIMEAEKSLEKMISHTNRTIFFIAPASRGKFFYPTDKKSGPPPYEKTLKALEKMRLSFTHKLIDFDFGQPISSLQEGARFLSHQLTIPLSQALDHARSIVTSHPSGLYLPNPRRAAFIEIIL